jgi:serine protease Do
MKHRRYTVRSILLIALAVIFILGLTQCDSQSGTKTAETAPAKAAPASAAPAPTAMAPSTLNWQTAIAKVAKETIPAVVHINISESREVANPLLPFSNDPFFHFFFNGRKMPRKFKEELRGLGTGMIIDEQGHILTNNHVVAGASKISVLLADGQSYPGKVVGTDPKTDLAVIQISANEKLPTVTFGDSDKIEQGDWVVAIGHPRGLNETVTQGIISAKHRSGVLNPTSYQDYLQTDAAINPGNSGGPLLNLEGQVIGVNAAIETQSGGFEGIGFAIPSNMAVHVAKELIANGKVSRGWLGVSIGDPTPEQMNALNLKSKKGSLIMDVVPGGPAQKAGLKKNDLVVKYQGQPVADSASLQSRVADTPIGTDASMEVMRDGKPVDVTVKIGDLNDAIQKMATSVEDRLGVDVRPLTAKETQQYGLEPGQGVALSSLKKDSALAKDGFEKDDVILAINNVPVDGVEGFVDIINALPPHQKTLLKAVDHRTGQSGLVQVQIG